MRFLKSLLINGLTIYACAAIFSGIQVDGILEAIIAALILGVVNFLIRPIITLFTLPITILTLGLFLLVINGSMVLITDWLLDGFYVNSLSWGILLSITLTIVNYVSGSIEKKEK